MLSSKQQFVNWGIRSALAMTLVAGSAGFAHAQGWYHADSDRYERDHYRDYDRDRRMASPVDATIRDLEQFARRTERRDSHHERVRFDNAIRNLSKFQDRYYRGKFDRGRLDQAIEDVDNVVKHNPLGQYARERLWNDLNNLRAFRDGRGSFDYGRRY